ALRHKDIVLKSESIIWTVVFVCEGGDRQVTTRVRPDGSFSASNVPAGLVKIAVVGAGPGPVGMPDPAKPQPQLDQKSRNLLDALSRFRDPDQSGLTYAVRKGSQTHDIDLP